MVSLSLNFSLLFVIIILSLKLSLCNFLLNHALKLYLALSLYQTSWIFRFRHFRNLSLSLSLSLSVRACLLLSLLNSLSLYLAAKSRSKTLPGTFPLRNRSNFAIFEFSKPLSLSLSAFFAIFATRFFALISAAKIRDINTPMEGESKQVSERERERERVW